MTETSPEIETVTVDFGEFRESLDFYMRARKATRLVITRDGAQVLVLGPWLPDEERTPAPDWFRRELHVEAPIHPDEPNFDERFWEYVREMRRST